MANIHPVGWWNIVQAVAWMMHRRDSAVDAITDEIAKRAAANLSTDPIEWIFKDAVIPGEAALCTGEEAERDLISLCASGAVKAAGRRGASLTAEAIPEGVFLSHRPICAHVDGGYMLVPGGRQNASTAAETWREVLFPAAGLKAAVERREALERRKADWQMRTAKAPDAAERRPKKKSKKGRRKGTGIDDSKPLRIIRARVSSGKASGPYPAIEWLFGRIKCNDVDRAENWRARLLRKYRDGLSR